MTTFQELNISQPIMKALQKMGFEEATSIQAETIPLAMAGDDVIGQAQTGTGKTAAFAIPMLEEIDPNQQKIQGLIVAPTRELAVQVAEEVNRLGQSRGIRSMSVYGGQPMGRQIRALKDGPNIVVATPGRLLDHIRRGTIRTADIKTAVLDEADEMLDMGFIEDIRAILQSIPQNRQTMLFSATISNDIQDIATNLMNQPKEVKIKGKKMTVDNVAQYFIEIPEKQKFDTLTNHLDYYAPKLAIVFCRTKKRVDEIADGLQTRGFRAEGIHGDLTQGKRMSVLNKFKRNRVDVLVATDVAARGLDISDVTHVYNFDIPQDPEGYVHRIGRTGRAGRKGEAISFITPREMGHLNVIESVTRSKIQRMPPPTNQEAKRGQQQLAANKLHTTIAKQSLADYYETVGDILQDHDAKTVVAAALKKLTKERRNIPVNISSIQPVSVKKTKQNKPKKGRPSSKASNDKRRQGGRRHNRRHHHGNEQKRRSGKPNR